jgi:hypothetical protein
VAAAERAHDGRHLGRGQPERYSPERLAEGIEAGKCDEDPAILKRSKRKPRVAVLEVNPPSRLPERRRDDAIS